MLPFIHSLDRAELRSVCAAMGEPAFRADQLWHWLYAQRVRDWDRMTNLPAALRRRLAAAWSMAELETVQTREAGDGACKRLAALADGEQIEFVVLPAPGRLTVCISSQVGCRFGCAFCASGQAGFVRQLAPGEMVAQVLQACTEDARPTHVVFMGIGEPLDNLDAVLTALRIINDADGLNIGARRITVSTCGVVPGIRRLAGAGMQVELSVSLHAADDALRSRLMPVNRRYPLELLLRTCGEYTQRTRRIITFEYTLVRDVNDRRGDAETLARRLRAFPCRVNLIPLSPVAEYNGAPADTGRAEAFAGVLARAGIHTTLRWSKGGAVNAACGQLRASRTGAPA
jgi:23S rRNA (adenine2503-C2)-methyltransferase